MTYKTDDVPLAETKPRSTTTIDVSASDLRDHLADFLNRVAYRDERIGICRRGKVVAVLAPAEDLELLDELEDRLDLEAIMQAEAEDAAAGREPVPLEDVIRSLRLSREASPNQRTPLALPVVREAVAEDGALRRPASRAGRTRSGPPARRRAQARRGARPSAGP